MSEVKEAKDFINMLAQDPALRGQVEAASEKVLAIARQHGKRFSRDDLAKAILEEWGDTEGEVDTLSAIVSEPPGE